MPFGHLSVIFMLIIEQKISFRAINKKIFHIITRLMIQVKHEQSKKDTGISEKQTTRNNKIILKYHRIYQRFPTHLWNSKLEPFFFQLC